MRSLIGIRGYKTALAVVICIVISNMLRLEFPFFVAIAAIISMERTIPKSIKAGGNRITGTIIGACVGLVCAVISPGSPLLCGFGLLAVIFFCNLFGKSQAIPISGVVFTGIMLTLKGRDPWQYSLNRTLDTLIGIVIAVVINIIVLPPKVRSSVLDADECGERKE